MPPFPAPVSDRVRRPWPRPRRTLPLAVALAAVGLGLPGCDAVGEATSCASIGVPEVGRVSATTPDGPFRTACANVVASDGVLVVVAREAGAGALDGRTIELTVEGTELGTYEVGEGRPPGGVSGAAFGPNPGATVGARSGSVTLTSLDGGIEGTFEFVTLTGVEITGGQFDLDL